METPKALTLITCDDIIDDKRTHKKSLIGIFNSILAKDFPVCHGRMNIYFTLTNCNGKYNIILECKKFKDTKSLVNVQGSLESKDSNAIFECAFELLNVSFPEPGKYKFQVLIDNKPVAERVFSLLKGDML
ncbi:MAG: hypothetical protein HYS08_02180 [Chlamydiae bacterium]|nr:hypothetical protein [Chlamydiota bacterium]MBI3266683.1 hypothetical protein [Chlamydiota bacterium]